MERSDVMSIVELWNSDLTFQEELRSDPVGAIERRGFSLSEEDQAALRAIEPDLTAEELLHRVQKLSVPPWA